METTDLHANSLSRSAKAGHTYLTDAEHIRRRWSMVNTGDPAYAHTVTPPTSEADKGVSHLLHIQQ